MITIILATLAGACFVAGKLAEARGRSADEKMGALIPYALAALFMAGALISLAF